MPPALTYRNFIYNEERGFVFAYVPKVACTNWKSIMRYLAGHSDYLDNALAHDRTRSGLRYLDLSGQDIAILSDTGIRKYACVRSPYSRSLSAYLNKIAPNVARVDSDQNLSHWGGITRKIEEFRVQTLGTSAHPVISFEVFLRWLKSAKPYLRNDEHWQLQAVLLRWPTVRFDYIGRFENLDADALILLDLMGCDIPFPSQSDVKFAPMNATAKAPEYLTDTTAALVKSIFQLDFEAFNFPLHQTGAAAPKNQTRPI